MKKYAVISAMLLCGALLGSQQMTVLANDDEGKLPAVQSESTTLSKLQEQLRVAESQLAVAQEQWTALNTQLAATQAQLQGKQAMIAQYEEQIKRLQSLLAPERNVEAENVQAELAKKESELQSIKSEVKVQETKVEASQQAVAQSEQSVQEAQKEVETIQKQVETLRQSMQQSEKEKAKAALVAEINKLQTDKQQAEKSANQIKEQLAQANEALQQPKNQTAQVEVELAKDKQEIEKTTQERTNLQDKRIQQNQKVNHLIQEKSQAQQEQIASKQTLDNLSTQKRQLADELAKVEASDEQKDLEEKIANTNHELEVVTRQITEKNQFTLSAEYIEMMRNYRENAGMANNPTLVEEGKRLVNSNVFMSKADYSEDDMRVVNARNLSKADRQLLTLWIAEILNDIQVQTGFPLTVKVTEASLAYANYMAEHYWKDFDHDKATLEKASLTFLNNDYAESIGIVRYPSKPDYYEKITIRDLKSDIYLIMRGMLFDDAHSDWGHALHLLGRIDSSGRYTQQSFGFDVTKNGGDIVLFESYLQTRNPEEKKEIVVPNDLPTLRRQAVELQAKLVTYRQEMSRLTASSEVVRLTELLSQVTEQISQAQATYQKAQQRTQTLEQQVTNEQQVLATLEASLESLVSKEEQLQQRIAQLEENLVAITQEMASKKQTVDQLQTQEKRAQEAITAIDTQITDLQKELDALQGERRRVRRALSPLDEAMAALEQAQNQLQLVQNEAKQAQENLLKAQEELASWLAKEASVQTEIDVLKNRLTEGNTIDRSAIEAKIAELTNQVANLKVEKQASEQRQVEQTQAVEKAKVAVEVAEAKVAELRKKIGEWKEPLSVNPIDKDALPKISLPIDTSPVQPVPKGDNTDGQPVQPVPKDGNTDGQSVQPVPKDDNTDGQPAQPAPKDGDKKAKSAQPIPKIQTISRLSIKQPAKQLPKTGSRQLSFVLGIWMLGLVILYKWTNKMSYSSGKIIKKLLK